MNFEPKDLYKAQEWAEKQGGKLHVYSWRDGSFTVGYDDGKTIDIKKYNYKYDEIPLNMSDEEIRDKLHSLTSNMAIYLHGDSKMIAEQEREIDFWNKLLDSNKTELDLNESLSEDEMKDIKSEAYKIDLIYDFIDTDNLKDDWCSMHLKDARGSDFEAWVDIHITDCGLCPAWNEDIFYGKSGERRKYLLECLFERMYEYTIAIMFDQRIVVVDNDYKEIINPKFLKYDKVELDLDEN